MLYLPQYTVSIHVGSEEIFLSILVAVIFADQNIREYLQNPFLEQQTSTIEL